VAKIIAPHPSHYFTHTEEAVKIIACILNIGGKKHIARQKGTTSNF
jgi:hypothetical protein